MTDHFLLTMIALGVILSGWYLEKIRDTLERIFDSTERLEAVLQQGIGRPAALGGHDELEDA